MCRVPSAYVVLMACSPLVAAMALSCGGSPKQAAVAQNVTTPVCPTASSAPALAPAAGATSSKIDEVAAELVRRMNAKDAPGMVAIFGDGMRKAFPVEKMTSFLDGFFEAKGRIESSSRVRDPQDESEGFYRFRTERGELRMELHIDPSGKVTGLRFHEPPAPAPPVVKSTVSLGLPYRGQWLVHWGGDHREVNHHVDHSSQRRAADLVMVGPDGKTHRTDGRTNKDYYAYGRDVLAVADGIVVAAVDGVQENEPGDENPFLVPGNMVIVKHADHLYSMYAHLQPAKLRVKVGARVKKGAVVGLCGNSGNSTEPHLHFQLQDGPRLEDSWGIEAVFDDVTVAHETKTSRVAHYTFLKGDLVGNQGNAL